MWAVKHKSGTVLFVTNCERTANNRREMGWIVEEAMTDMRKDFESWLEDVHGLYGEDVEWQPERNCYAKFGIHLAWCAWQASREAVEIGLPDIYGGKYTPSSITMDGFDFEEYLTDLYAAIEQENIRVKK